MRNVRILAISLWMGGLATSMLLAGDFSNYRSFQLGMNPSMVLKQIGINQPETKVIHRMPALIEEIEWNVQHYATPSGEPDSVKEIRFTFYNGELFRMTVIYDRYKTEGLTADDFIEAISTSKNATPERPNTEIVFPVTSNENGKVVARWVDSKYAINLVSLEYQQSLVMVLFSKEAETLARTAIIQAIKVEEHEAPQREIERQKKQDLERLIQQEKARLLNKPSFRP